MYLKPQWKPAPPRRPTTPSQFCATGTGDFSPKASRCIMCFVLFVVVILFLFLSARYQSTAKPSSPSLTNPTDQGPGSVKCVGHFGFVRAGGTQSNCSLEGEGDRASLSLSLPLSPLHQTGSTSSPKQSGRARRAGRGRWRRAAARRDGRARKAGGRGKVKRR